MRIRRDGGKHRKRIKGRGVSHENYIDSTSLYCALQLRADTRLRAYINRVKEGCQRAADEEYRICHVLHGEVMPKRGDIGNINRFWEAIRRINNDLRPSVQTTDLKEWASDMGTEIPDNGYDWKEHLGRYCKTSGLRPRTQSKKTRGDRGLNPGGVPCPGRKSQGRKNKSQD